MAENINQEASRRMFLKMRDKGLKLTAICDVLCEVNTEADEDDVFQFVADCDKIFVSREKVTTRKSQPIRRQGESYSSSGCGGSESSRSGC